MPSNILKEYTNELILSLTDFNQNTFNDVKSFDIDCAVLPIVELGYKASEQLNAIIGELHFNNNDDPAIYWIEIVSDHTAKDIHSTYAKFKDRVKCNLPAYKKTFKKWDSKILYVGKVKSNMAGRMILHLGYGDQPNMQGLHLCYWQHIKGLKLRLNVIPLSKNIEAIVPVFELKLANELHPILGKHR